MNRKDRAVVLVGQVRCDWGEGEKRMRIISGEARGRKFEAPAGHHTRPTTDRVKESLFGILQFEMEGAVILDLFSGSGNLGWEAVSRGAKKAYLNDQDAACAQLIRRNAKHLGFEDRATISAFPFEMCLKKLKQQQVLLDIIFLDPPYGLGLEDQAIEIIEKEELLRERGCIVVEHQRSVAPKFPVEGSVDSRCYGDICVSIYRKNEGSN